jgi:hypothetical protein
MHGNQTLIEHRNEELTCGNVGITSSKSFLKHLKGVLHFSHFDESEFWKVLGDVRTVIECTWREKKGTWKGVGFHEETWHSFLEKGESLKMKNKNLARGNRSRRILWFWKSMVHNKLCVCGWRRERGVGRRGIGKEEVNISVGWVSQFYDTR